MYLPCRDYSGECCCGTAATLFLPSPGFAGEGTGGRALGLHLSRRPSPLTPLPQSRERRTNLLVSAAVQILSPRSPATMPHLPPLFPFSRHSARLCRTAAR